MTTATATRTKKTATRKPAKTIEEKKAQAEALHQSISDQVEALRDSDRWTAFLDFAQSFHAYSLNNVLLILSQMPEASRVAGFRKWQSLNRQVRKGSKGIKIFGYSTKKVTEEDENGDEVEKKIARFPILSVFDIGQTDLIDPEAGDPGTITAQLTGADDHGIVDALSSYLTGEGWTVERRPIQGQKNGYTLPEEMAVIVDADLSPEHAAKTLIHDLLTALRRLNRGHSERGGHSPRRWGSSSADPARSCALVVGRAYGKRASSCTSIIWKLAK